MMKYLFLNSYFNAREKQIADPVDFERMIGKESFKESFEVLQDTDYSKWALETDDLSQIFRKEKVFFRNELIKLGAKELTNLFFLRADITNLRIYLKSTLFDLDSGDLLEWGKSEKQLKSTFEKEIKEASDLDTPAKVDDYLTEVYLKKLEEFAGKDKSVLKFIEKYREIIDGFEGESRENRLKDLEDEFISSQTKKNEGLAPILAFFMKKWRAEKKIKAIMDGKKIGFNPKEIKSLTENLRAL